MSKTIIMANWKMKLYGKEAEELAEEFTKLYKPFGEVEVVLCPDYLNLQTVSKKIKGKEIKLGAQDCFWEESGAFTGEVSPRSLKEVGCEYVIIGHSERRTFLGETDEMVNKKVLAVLKEGLIPVICVGETFEERQEGNKDFVVMNQVSKALEGVDIGNNELVIAYEPVWVIGSGQAVMPEEAEHTHQVIRQVLVDKFELDTVKEKIRIIYGGSVEPLNIQGFLAMNNIKGVLVGGASLDSNIFNELVKSAS